MTEHENTQNESSDIQPRDHRNVKYLSDEPCHEGGAFDAHPLIAKAIVQQIVESEPDNIAIVGEWGSGKSSILADVERQLPNNYLFFSFDAWAHSGDSLRKSFILSLCDLAKTRFKDDEKTVDDLQKVEDGLTGTSITTHQVEKTKFPPLTSGIFSAVGAYALLSVLFSCIVEIIGQVGIDAFPFSLSQILSHDWLKVLLSLATGIGVYLAQRHKQGPDVLSTNLLDEISGFFGNRPFSATIKQDVKPSSLDSLSFENNFRDVLKILDDKKTVLVAAFDNMDRLSSRELQNAWNTLQIFAGSSRGKSWVLLPAAKSIFSHFSYGEAENADRSMAKLFQVKFEVPLPISTAWKGYFMRCAQEAFPDEGNQNLELVYSIACRHFGGQEARLPRNAKLFLNEMVSLARVYPDMSIISMAIYCYIEHEYPTSVLDEVLSIVSGTSKHERLIWQVEQQDPHARSDLAMLLFGQTTREAAEEAFAVSMVHSSLSSEEQLPIAAMTKGRPGTWNLIYSTIEEIIETERASDKWLFLQLRALGENCLRTDGPSSQSRLQLASLLLSATKHAQFLDYPGMGVVVGEVLQMADRSECERVLNMWVDGLRNAVMIEGDSRERDSFFKDFYDVANCLDEACGQTWFKEIDLSALEQNIEAYLNWLAKDESECAWLSKISISGSDVIARMLRIVYDRSTIDAKEGDYISSAIAKMKATWRRIEPSQQFDDILSAFEGELGEPGAQARMKIAAWILINEYDCAEVSLVKLFNQLQVNYGALRGVISTEVTKGNAALLDMILNDDALLSALDEECDSPLFSDNQVVLLRQLKPTSFDSIVGKVEGSRDNKLLRKLFNSAWKNSDVEELPIETMLLFADLNNNRQLRINLGKQLARANRESDLMNVPFSLDWRSVYLGVLELAPSKEFCGWILSGLQSITEAQWDWRIRNWSADNSLFAILGHYDLDEESLPNLEQAAMRLLCQGTHARKIQHLKLVGPAMKSVELLEEIDGVFFNGGDWRPLSAYAPNVLVDTRWLEHLGVSDRVQVVEMILATNANSHCLLLEQMIVSASIPPKKLFPSRLKHVKGLLKRAIARKSMREDGKKSCERILDLLT